MIIINGTFHYQVKDLLEALKDHPPEAIILATNKDGGDRTIYKDVCTEDDKLVYLYLGEQSNER